MATDLIPLPNDPTTIIARMHQSQSNDPTLSGRGSDLASHGGLRDGFGRSLLNPYHPKTNPTGFVNIGTSESYIMQDEVAQFANQNLHFSAYTLSYGEGPWGCERLRQAMANHITKHFHPVNSISHDDILFSNGVTSLSEQLGFSICDSGDGILFPRPVYQAFRADFGTRANAIPVFVSFDGEDNFQSTGTIKHYEAAYNAAETAGIKIRAVLLCNPHNPLGRCHSPPVIIELMKFCQQRKLHLIANEIYALSVYEVHTARQPEGFTSVLSFDSSEYIDDQYLHVLYGMSKDFASGGVRLGCIYSRNKQLIRAMGAMSQFHWIAGPSELLATLMLEDEKWMDGFLALSKQRLAERSALTRQLLDELDIRYDDRANAGLFMLIDLRKWLRNDSWEAEAALSQKLREGGVALTSGTELTSEQPGWFRLIFSQEEDVLREGMKRVGRVLKAVEKEEHDTSAIR